MGFMQGILLLASLLGLAGHAAAVCSTPLQVATQLSNRYSQVLQCINLANSPSINNALNSKSASNTVFVPTDQAWNALATSLNKTFTEMCLTEQDRLRRIIAYNIGRALPNGEPWDNVSFLIFGPLSYLNSLLVVTDTNTKQDVVYIIAANTTPDPVETTNPRRASFSISNPRIDDRSFAGPVGVQNPRQACNSVVFSSQFVLMPGNGVPRYPWST